MKPDNVNTVFLTGATSNIMSTFLFQCANYYSEQGFKVLYIAPSPWEKLPPIIHGTDQPTRDTVSLIRFFYFQQWQDLLKHMFKMHIHPYVPRVIIIEKLNYYCKLFPEEENTQEKYEHEVHSAKICASLIDATSVCAKRCKNDTVLLVSFEQNQRQGNLVNMIVDTYFSSTLWLFDETNEENKDIISIKSSSCAGLGKHAKLEFIHLKESETLILQKIVNFAGLTL
ncbi:hypothetical protein R5R35_006294 [Gryllus longicercus]|uniref:Uncharacterized protein n=1 Tax=Gryllus longicercus TaxID=2509291 RepID=A0AAN9ZJL5_9ORTH